MLYLTCTTIISVDLARYGVSRAKDWVSVDCGTKICYFKFYCISSLEFIYDFLLFRFAVCLPVVSASILQLSVSF